MRKITEKTELLINKYFKVTDRNVVTESLINECGCNLPFCEKYSLNDLDRVRFAVIKLSRGSMERFREAIDLAKLDWRDLLMHVDFATDINAHKIWADDIIKNG